MNRKIKQRSENEVEQEILTWTAVHSNCKMQDYYCLSALYSPRFYLTPAPVWLQDNSLETVSLSNTCKTTWLIFCCRINWPEAYRQVLNSGPTSNCCLNDLPTACLDTVTDSLSWYCYWRPVLIQLPTACLDTVTDSLSWYVQLPTACHDTVTDSLY